VKISSFIIVFFVLYCLSFWLEACLKTGLRLAVWNFYSDRGSRKKRYKIKISVMTKNKDIDKNNDCPEGWTINQQSASLKLADNALHCQRHFAWHLTDSLSNKSRSSF
jgi:hypothetical protein